MRSEKAVYLDDFPRSQQMVAWAHFQGRKFVSIVSLDRKTYGAVSELEKRCLREMVETMKSHNAKILIQF